MFISCTALGLFLFFFLLGGVRVGGIWIICALFPSAFHSRFPFPLQLVSITPYLSAFPIFTAVMRQWDDWQSAAGTPAASKPWHLELAGVWCFGLWPSEKDSCQGGSDAARYLSVFSSNRFILLHFHGAVNRQRLRVPAPAVAPEGGAQWNYICLEDTTSEPLEKK